MLINIIKNFIYEKNLKDKTNEDIKNYYGISLISGGIVTLICSSMSTLLAYLLDKFNGNDLITVPLFVILFLSIIITLCAAGISAKLILERLFCINKIKKKIEEKSFNLELINSEKKESYYELSSEEFFNNYNYILGKNLTKEEIKMIIDDFMKSGLSENEIKSFIKKRMEYKDKFEITLNDFCFIADELEKVLEINMKKDKKIKISEIVDNICIKV